MKIKNNYIYIINAIVITLSIIIFMLTYLFDDKFELIFIYIFITLVILIFIINLGIIIWSTLEFSNIRIKFNFHVDKSQYIEFIEMFNNYKCCFSDSEQLTLYCMGYMKLMLNNLDEANAYFIKIETSKIRFRCIIPIIGSIIHRFLINLYYNNEDELVNIENLYHQTKEELLGLSKNNSKVIKGFNIIEKYFNNELLEVKNLLKDSSFSEYKFVQELLNSELFIV